MTTREFQGQLGNPVPESNAFWPEPPSPPKGAPNVLIMMLDDVGFADFGCYGSEIHTPTIDSLAGAGVRYTGFHTTAMCSTTRAALLTGRNHHSVGMGCLANFDSGFPGYRGKIDPEAQTLAEILRPHGYRNYYVGKWHVTPLTESGPTGPFSGWPLGRGFDRFYGFLDAETDQYSPELVQDNSHVTPRGTYDTGYHLTEDLMDHAIDYGASHEAALPQVPWMMMVMPGACHAPHQAPKQLIDKYDHVFAKGWDQTRADRLANQIELGICPSGTELPPHNQGVRPWADCSPDEQRLFTRLQAAYAAMLEHTDTHFGRVIQFLEQSGQLENTLVLVLSDNGASQEGGPLGFVNAMGPYNGIKEPMAQKLARIDDIGGPDTHSNFPHGWAMAANTPLKRYKQNTHGGGIRDPLVISGPGLSQGALSHVFCHVTDLAPSVLERIGVAIPGEMEGTSFAQTMVAPAAKTEKSTQYFEMFGHRGMYHEGWKAVAYHQPGTPFEDDEWELYDLAHDFNENHDLALAEPGRLKEMTDLWWQQAAKNKVLPLDDRFAERFAENAERHRAGRTSYTFWKGMGHLASDVAPDLRSRSYTINAHVEIPDGGVQGVLVSHGDPTSGYSLFIRDNRLVHDLNIGGSHQIVTSEAPVPTGPCTLGFRMRRVNTAGGPPAGEGTLLINGESAGAMTTNDIFSLMVSWSGLDIGLDRGSTVSDYDRTGRHIGPAAFTGQLLKVTVELDDDQQLDHDGVAATALSRE